MWWKFFIKRTTRIRFKLFVWYFRFIYAIIITFKIAWLFRLYSRSASRCKHIYFFLSNSNIWQEIDLFELVHLFVKKTNKISLTHAKKLRSYVYYKVFNDQQLNVLVINLKKKKKTDLCGNRDLVCKQNSTLFFVNKIREKRKTKHHWRWPITHGRGCSPR